MTHRSILLAALLVLAGCNGSAPEAPAAGSPASRPSGTVPANLVTAEEDPVTAPDPASPKTLVATFGAGCFWCVEAVLEQLEGVVDVESGYMGGSVDDPTYEQVCSGASGHAEVVQVRFDPARIGYDELLVWFWKLHDPTTLNRQGADVGTQYRSAIFYHDEGQRQQAEASRAAAQKDFARPIVTEITAASRFWSAEKYHQDYYRGNKQQGYCRAVITPKLDKLGLEK